MNEQNPTLNLQVNLETLRVIFAGLDELPGKFGRPVLAELEKQAAAQLQAPPPQPLQQPESD